MLVLPYVQNVPGKNSELSPSGYSLYQCFSTGVPRVTAMGSAMAKTDRNCLGRNSQPQFYAVVAWIIVQGSMRNTIICGKIRCSKNFEEHWTTPTGKRSEVRPMTRWCDYISDLAWSRLGVEPVEVSEITVDREVFRVFLRLLLPRLEKGKSGTKRSK